ncbi:MAG: YcaO-like family protein [Synechocystis sp.]|nr:YcaO-like family protein [Synechocystis sp.]
MNKDYHLSLFEAGTAVPFGESLMDMGIVVAESNIVTVKGELISIMVSGKGNDIESRILSAKGELVERCSILTAKPDWIGSFKNAQSAVCPKNLILDSLALLPSSVSLYCENTVVEWTEFTSLIDQQKKLIHRPTNSNHPIFFIHNSNGAAAHFNRETAIINGLLELIEKHSLLNHWYHRKAGLNIEPRNCIQEVEWLAKHGFQIVFQDISFNEIVPVVWCFAFSQETGKLQGGVVTGCSAGRNLEQACKSAILEVIQTIEIALMSARTNSLKDINENIYFYLDVKNKVAFDFLFRDAINKAKEVGEIQNLSDLVEKLEKLNYEPFFVERNSLDCEYTVVETVVPGLQPLTLGVDKKGSRTSNLNLSNNLVFWPQPLG